MLVRRLLEEIDCGRRFAACVGQNRVAVMHPQTLAMRQLRHRQGGQEALELLVGRGFAERAALGADARRRTRGAFRTHFRIWTETESCGRVVAILRRRGLEGRAVPLVDPRDIEPRRRWGFEAVRSVLDVEPRIGEAQCGLPRRAPDVGAGAEGRATGAAQAPLAFLQPFALLVGLDHAARQRHLVGGISELAHIEMRVDLVDQCVEAFETRVVELRRQTPIADRILVGALQCASILVGGAPPVVDAGEVVALRLELRRRVTEDLPEEIPEDRHPAPPPPVTKKPTREYRGASGMAQGYSCAAAPPAGPQGAGLGGGFRRSRAGWERWHFSLVPRLDR